VRRRRLTFVPEHPATCQLLPKLSELAVCPLERPSPVRLSSVAAADCEAVGSVDVASTRDALRQMDTLPFSFAVGRRRPSVLGVLLDKYQQRRQRVVRERARQLDGLGADGRQLHDQVRLRGAEVAHACERAPWRWWVASASGGCCWLLGVQCAATLVEGLGATIALHVCIALSISGCTRLSAALHVMHL
jgi:hypothetical protein